MSELKILGLLISDRIKEAGRTQSVLNRYHHLIKSRLGYHEVSSDVCSRVGFIVIHLTGRKDEWQLLEQELSEIGGLEVKSMLFEY
jgi:hypothetical protein